MIYTYKDCIKKFKNDFNLKKVLKTKKLFKIKSGIYSDTKNISDLELFLSKNKNIIFTMDSAFYFYGMTDNIPSKYCVSTDRDSFKIKRKNTVQYFNEKKIFKIGLTTIPYHGIKIPIYDKERMLIELLRYKNKLPFDFYKEIISYYRNHIDDIDVEKLSYYLEDFPKKNMIERTLQLEVL